MRFVDTAPLQLPAGWQGRATQALADVRNEIEQADADARAAGRDTGAARKAAIAAALRQPARQEIWRELNPLLARLSRGKCWYSESLNPTSDKNVDHFRPKGRVEEDPTHEGYWWLAFESSNFRFASQWCNQRRVDDEHGTSGGKEAHFPLLANGVRARQEGDNLLLEDPELLDPTDPEDWKLLTFLPDGYPTPSRPAGTLEHQRALKSIEIYHLHCKPLANGRFCVAGAIQRIVQDLESYRPRIDDDLQIRALYKRRQVDLIRAIHSDAEYSAAARAYVRAEIYKLDRGHQVKRDWLEEMLVN